MRRAMTDEGSAAGFSGAGRSGVVQSAGGAALRAIRFPARPRAAVLVLHGGSPDDAAPVAWHSPAVLRMVPLARSVGRRVPDVATVLLKHAVAGWNGGGSPLADLDWALARIRHRHPGLPVVLLGHSMGGRTAVHRATAPGVAGAVLLAPWLPDQDPVDGVTDRPLVVVQASWDRTIPTATTEVWLRRAAGVGAVIDRELLAGTEHTMVLRFPTWHRRAASGVQRLVPTRHLA
jgi:hypothetical protein